MLKLSDITHKLQGQPMFQILAKTQELERQGKEILHFELGDPDFSTPSNIIAACYSSLKNGYTHYCPSSGLKELKEIAAEVTLRSRKFKPDINQLVVCPGANAGIFFAILCAVNPGNDVIVPNPSFVSYFSILRMLGINIVDVPLKEENNFRLNPNDVRDQITKKTRMIIINSPSNPTGSVMTKQEIKEIYNIAKEHDIYLLSDEIYARMIYEDKETSFSSPSIYDECKERTIIVNGFSKSFAMTGWRLGVITGPANLIEKMGLALETTLSCVAPFIQKAGIEALKGDQTEIFKMKDTYRNRRDVIFEGLNNIPLITCINPTGAFYAFPNITKTGLTSDEFTAFLLDKAGVAVSPGNIFGKYGEGFVRFSYVSSIENIKKALHKIKVAIKENIL
jgi:aspartate/methionine/tyrosine aminotransferase